MRQGLAAEADELEAGLRDAHGAAAAAEAAAARGAALRETVLREAARLSRLIDGLARADAGGAAVTLSEQASAAGSAAV